MEKMKQMGCEEINSETLLLYAYGELNEGLRNAVLKHVESCPVCKAELSEILEVRAASEDRSMPAKPSPQAIAKLQLMARERLNKSPLSSRLKEFFQPALPFRLAVASALVATLIAGLVFYSGWRSASAPEEPGYYDMSSISDNISAIEVQQQEIWSAWEEWPDQEPLLAMYFLDDPVEEIESEMPGYSTQETEEQTDLSDIDELEREFEEIFYTWPL